MTINHNQYLELAFHLAEKNLGKTKLNPSVGTVVVKNGTVISSGVTSFKGRPHSEFNALDSVKNCSGASLYTTLEPCLMCFGAIINSRIKRLVIGAIDEEHGAPISNKELLDKLKLNHKIDIEIGLFSEKCSSLLKNFFKEKRSKTKFCPNRGVI